jgi:alpha-mannosidase
VGTSDVRISLPATTVPGYARTLAGEEIEYHGPVPGVTRALVVRSEDAARSIAWETAPVPSETGGGDDAGAVTFAMLAAIDANEDRRSFTLLLDGRPAVEITNPAVAEQGVLAWEGATGIRLELRVTLVDRYADAMGVLFLHVPRPLVRAGEPVRLEVRGESAGTRTWFLLFPYALAPEIRVRQVPAVVRSPDGPRQELRVDVLRLDAGGPLAMESPAGRRRVGTRFGHTGLALDVPAVERRTPIPLAFELDGRRFETAIDVDPVRPLTLHLVHHTHLDIGYTHDQDAVERIQWGHLEEALRLGERSAEAPPGSRFVWHPEALWAVETYLESHDREACERLVEGIRSGWIHLDALHTNLLPGIATAEGLVRELEPARRIAARTGVLIRSAMFTDIPGMTWGMIPVLAAAGVRYLSVGPNRWHRIGRFLSTWGDRPFWWESASGDARVLVWVHGEGYSLFHTGLGYAHLETQLEASHVFATVERLRERGWTLPIAALRYNIGSDNGPPDPTLSDAVRGWNERYLTPRLAIGSSESVLAALEELCGEELPVVRGDLTGHWEDGVASTARETQSVRRTAEWLAAVETLAAMRGLSLDPEVLYAAWRQVLLFYEHTWGAWNSVTEPDAPLVRRQWERKRAFAVEAAERTNALAAEALGDLVATGAVGTADDAIEIVNPLGWTRDEVVVLDRVVAGAATRVIDADGETLPTQALADGGLAFRPPPVPGFGSVRVRLAGAASSPAGEDDRTGRERPSPMPAAPRGDADHRVVLDNGIVQLGLDPLTGRVVSLRRVDGDGPSRDAVPQGEELFGWLHVPGRDPARAVTAGGGEVEVLEAGPLVWHAVVRRPAPGTRDGLATSIRLFAGSDRVELELRFDKERCRDPEAVLLRVPSGARTTDARAVVGGVLAPFEAETEQPPGANRNWFVMERWTDLHDGLGGLTLISVDAPLVQLGSVGTDPIVAGWREEVDRAPVLYSYLMNNYWETNYRAEQEGPHAVRYWVRPHGGFDVADADRCAMGAAHPLLSLHVREDAPRFAPPVAVEAARSVVTLVRREPDGGLLVRLVNPTRTPDRVRLTRPDAPAARPEIVDPWGGPVPEARGDGTVVVGPRSLATVRLRP